MRNLTPWRQKNWTRLYESALFEQHAFRLLTRIDKAQLAVLERELEIRCQPAADTNEKLALQQAQAVLQQLRRLSHQDAPVEEPGEKNGGRWLSSRTKSST